LNSVVIKSIDAAEVSRAVDAYAARLLAEHAEIEEIVVFGSFATGTYAPGSDVDLLIVLTAASEPVRDRIPSFLPGRFPVGVDIFPYTREELDARRDSPLLTQALKSEWRYGRAPG
jgi:predicted nucleotidyltransferase